MKLILGKEDIEKIKNENSNTKPQVYSSICIVYVSILSIRSIKKVLKKENKRKQSLGYMNNCSKRPCLFVCMLLFNKGHFLYVHKRRKIII